MRAAAEIRRGEGEKKGRVMNNNGVMGIIVVKRTDNDRVVKTIRLQYDDNDAYLFFNIISFSSFSSLGLSMFRITSMAAILSVLNSSEHLFSRLLRNAFPRLSSSYG